MLNLESIALKIMKIQYFITNSGNNFIQIKFLFIL